MASRISQSDFHLHIVFRVDDIGKYIHEDLSRRMRDRISLGLGWWIQIEAREIDDDVFLELSLETKEDNHISRKILFSAVGESLCGKHRYFDEWVSGYFSWGSDSLVLSGLLSLRQQWVEDGPLYRDKAVVIHATVQSPPGPSIYSQQTLGVLTDTIAGGEVANHAFEAYYLSSDTLVKQTFAVRMDALHAECPALEDWCVNRNTLLDLLEDPDETEPNELLSRLKDNLGEDSDWEDGVNNRLQSEEEEDEEEEEDVCMADDGTSTPSRGLSVSEQLDYAYAHNAADRPRTPILARGDIDILRTPVKMEDLMLEAFQFRNIMSQAPQLPATRVIGVAAHTWHAFLFYMYTGTVVFAPLRSEGNRRAVYIKAYITQWEPHRPRPCSCKSMYRLARKLGMIDLQKLALAHLRSRLTPECVMTEILSRCSVDFEEVRQLGLEYLKSQWDAVKTCSTTSEIVSDISSGKYSYAGSVVFEILRAIGG